MSFLYVINITTRDNYKFLQRHIQFFRNDNKINKGHEHYDHLFKVSYVLDKLIKIIVKEWTSGQEIKMDEIMIKYKGQAVVFIQLITEKPIKNSLIFLWKYVHLIL